MFQPANAQSLIGIVFVLGLCWLLSENRKRFPVKLAIGSLIIQVGLVLLLFGLPRLDWAQNAYNPLYWLSAGVQGVLHGYREETDE